MFFHHQFYKTPLKKKQNSIFYETIQPTAQQTLNKQTINELYNKFNTLNTTIDIDLTKNNFNLIEYEKENQKIKYDPQIMTAKLRRLQNQAQINRIDMQLQLRRKKRKHSHFKPIPNEFQTRSYKKNYDQFLKNSKLIEMFPHDSQSQQEQNQPKHQKISRFHQLKKYSKILDFTMQKIQEKQQNSIKQLRQMSLRKQNVKQLTNNLKDYGEFNEMARKIVSSTRSVSSQYNPEVIIEDKFKRIMTMKAKDKVSDQVKRNPRCNKLMNLQNDILLDLQKQQKSLSKENTKRLKSRFIQIVNELQKGDRKRKQIKFLPSLQLAAYTSRRIQNELKIGTPYNYKQHPNYKTSRQTHYSKSIQLANQFNHYQDQIQENIQSSQIEHKQSTQI